MRYDGSEGLETHVKTDRANVRLLVAEDSHMIRKQIVDVLHKAGYAQVEQCPTGKVAYDFLRAAPKGTIPIDGMISDIEMPEMDGLTLCKKIRAELQWTELPIVMFSSLISVEMERKCRSVGATSCITKPQIGQLVMLIDGYCLKKS